MKNKNINASLEGSIVKAIFNLATPILLANLLQGAYQLIDAFWVGKLGGNAVAAVSVSFPVTYLTLALWTGFAIAGSILIAQYVWAKNFKMVNHVAAQTMLMIVVVSSVLGGIGIALSPFLLRLMGVSSEVFPDALGFMRISFVGLLFVFGFAVFQSIMRWIGEAKLPLYIVFGTVCLNFVLDPLFIYGYSFVPEMGVAGAAMATLLTQGIAMWIGFATLLGGKYGIHLSLKDFVPDFVYIKRAFFLWFPTSVEISTRALGMVIMTFLVASFGTVTVASYGAGGNILQVVMILAMGFSMATSVLVWQNIGAGNPKRASKIAQVSALLSFAVLTALGIVAFFTAPYLIGFFVPNDPAVIEWGAKLIRTWALAFGFLGIQMSMIAVFRASGNMVTALVIALVSQWVLQFPLAYVLSKHTALGADGIWYSFPITSVIAAIGCVLWFMTGKWQKTRLTKEGQLKEKIAEETIIEEGAR